MLMHAPYTIWSCRSYMSSCYHLPPTPLATSLYCVLTSQATSRQAYISIWLVFDWLGDWLAGWVINWLADWLIGRLTGWMIDWLGDWLDDWLTDWLTDWVIDWLMVLVVISWLVQNQYLLLNLQFRAHYNNIKQLWCPPPLADCLKNWLISKPIIQH